MIFIETELEGAYLIELELLEDERGFFARSFCRREFEARGLNPNVVQSSISFNKKKGTLRGMHYQTSPWEEIKVVRCLRGGIYDVIIDLRRQSKTYRRWVALELTADNRRMIYVPEGCAHGFQTLDESSEVFYQMSTSYHPESARGVRWDDPAFAINWPIGSPILSDRDRAYPDF